MTNQAGSQDYTATRFEYARNRETVTHVLGETWECTLSCSSPSNFDVTFAREFRYDSGRQRYLNRELDPGSAKVGLVVELSATWSDYDGDEIYGDFTTGPTTNTRSFEPGLGTVTTPGSREIR